MASYEPGYVETRSRWWLTGAQNRKRRAHSPLRRFADTTVDCAALFRMVAKCLNHVGERLREKVRIESHCKHHLGGF